MRTVILEKSKSKKRLDWEKIRRDFPILEQEVHGHPLIYFDNAASTQKPRKVIDAIVRYYEKDHANVHRGIHELSNRATAAYEGARARAARFFNAASSSEIIFTRGTTESINLISASWGNANLKPNDRILLTEMEHHSNLIPWQRLAKSTGAELVYVPIRGLGEGLEMSELDRLLTKKVKMIACVHISNSLGTINPVKEICQRARSVGAISIIDGAQSAGHLKVDVRSMGCDFYVFSGHKMCAPTGIGGLYGRYDLLEAMPPYHGGGEMIEEVDYFEASYKLPPHRFEAGTPNVAGAVGLHSAMDYLDEIGREHIADHDAGLTKYAFEILEGLKGITLFGPKGRRGAVLSLLLNDVNANDLVEYVDKKGIALRGGHHCTQPLMRKLGVPSTARASFYFYNRQAEIDVLLDALEKARHLFAGK